MRVLSGADVSSTLLALSNEHFERLQDEMSQALVKYSADQRSQSERQIHQPPRSHINTSRGFTTLVMPTSDTVAIAVKTVTLVPSRSAVGAVTVHSAEGELEGVLNASELTAFRTALVSSTVVKRTHWFSRDDSPSRGASLVVFGSGKQAEWHVRLLLRTLPLQRITIINRSQKRLVEMNESGFMKDLQTKYPHLTLSTIAEEGNHEYERELRGELHSSDIICCTTPSTKPLFPAEFLGLATGTASPKRRIITLIGSYKPNMMEVDTQTLLSGVGGRVLVDSIDDCLIESGEIIKAKLGRDQLTEVGELFSSTTGLNESYSAQDANIVFKCVGMALMDLTVARTLLEISKELRKGIEVDDF